MRTANPSAVDQKDKIYAIGDVAQTEQTESRNEISGALATDAGAVFAENIKKQAKEQYTEEASAGKYLPTLSEDWYTNLKSFAASKDRRLVNKGEEAVRKALDRAIAQSAADPNVPQDLKEQLWTEANDFKHNMQGADNLSVSAYGLNVDQSARELGNTLYQIGQQRIINAPKKQARELAQAAQREAEHESNMRSGPVVAGIETTYSAWQSALRGGEAQKIAQAKAAYEAAVEASTPQRPALFHAAPAMKPGPTTQPTAGSADGGHADASDTHYHTHTNNYHTEYHTHYGNAFFSNGEDEFPDLRGPAQV